MEIMINYPPIILSKKPIITRLISFNHIKLHKTTLNHIKVVKTILNHIKPYITTRFREE